MSTPKLSLATRGNLESSPQSNKMVPWPTQVLDQYSLSSALTTVINEQTYGLTTLLYLKQ